MGITPDGKDKKIKKKQRNDPLRQKDYFTKFFLNKYHPEEIDKKYKNEDNKKLICFLFSTLSFLLVVLSFENEK